MLREPEVIRIPKKKYRELTKKYHPDLNPGDAEAAKKAVARK